MIGRGQRSTGGMTENEYDLIIIGGGAAGIAAAHAARDAGIRAIVVEAQDRVGGRAFTDFESFSEPFDHGCQWLHAADVNPLDADGRAARVIAIAAPGCESGSMTATGG